MTVSVIQALLHLRDFPAHSGRIRLVLGSLCVILGACSSKQSFLDEWEIAAAHEPRDLLNNVPTLPPRLLLNATKRVSRNRELTEPLQLLGLRFNAVFAAMDRLVPVAMIALSEVSLPCVQRIALCTHRVKYLTPATDGLQHSVRHCYHGRDYWRYAARRATVVGTHCSPILVALVEACASV